MRSAKVALGQALTRHPVLVVAVEAVGATGIPGIPVENRLGLLLRRAV